MEEAKKIRICLVEDTKAISENLKTFFEFYDDFEVAHISYSIESFMRFLDKHKTCYCDLLLLDIGLPGISGLEGLPMIKEREPKMNIVMLTTYDDEKTILKALCSGAVGYISKKTSLEDIVKAARIVHNGGSYMSPSIAREIINHFTSSSSPKLEVKSEILTKRQIEILELLVEGSSYNSVAEQLHISIETVKSHIKNIYRDLNVNNKAGAVAKYLRGEI